MDVCIEMRSVADRPATITLIIVKTRFDRVMHSNLQVKHFYSESTSGAQNCRLTRRTSLPFLVSQ